MWVATGLKDESDVEQKFIYPFLIAPHPQGLGIPPSVVQTKASLRRFSIGKGKDQKLYYPDYLLVNAGLPLAVIEAKSPSEPLDEAFREARLYAAELNAIYDHGFSPVKYIVACNGKELWYGHADHASPKARVDCDTLGPYSVEIADLISLIGWSSLKELSDSLGAKLRPHAYHKPRKMVGGLALQNEEIGHNSFGETLASLISPVINPMTRADRARVARHAYVSSKRRERYIDPIDRVIRAALPASETDTTLLEDTGRPQELVSKLYDRKTLEHKVMLLIGSVGSGKSTFVDYLQEVALPDELIGSMVWCRLNMNLAPLSKDEIYPWLRKGIIGACKASLPLLDFEELATIKKVYGIELNAFDKGVGKLYASVPETYALKLAELIDSLISDPAVCANAYVRFACAQRGKLLTIVLDNCDKKERDDQLLMFQAAQWLQNEFRALVILPMRDETYDNHRSQPPLDTALKDLAFRIEPPLFQHVLVKRVQLALQSLETTGADRLYYRLPNGIRVEYQKTEQSFYLTSILRSLFEHDLFARRMIVGLSGRDMRRALEIFLEFCRSAYIGDDQIFKIRQSEGKHTLPFHQVATVLIRMNRRFYDSDHSYTKNIFAIDAGDSAPSFFSRYLVLVWLKERFKKAGPSTWPGYFKKSQIKQALVPYGLTPEILDREINYLLHARCLVAEHLRIESASDDDLIRIGPAGFVHLDIAWNVIYLSAVAEDTYFISKQRAERVADRIRSLNNHVSIGHAIANSQEVVEHLAEMLRKAVPGRAAFMDGDLLHDLGNLEEARESITREQRAHVGDKWFDADSRYPAGSTHTGVVTNVSPRYGFFVELDCGLHGLIHNDKSGGMSPSGGDRVEVKVIKVSVALRKIRLRLLSIVAEDVGDQVVVSGSVGM